MAQSSHKLVRSLRAAIQQLVAVADALEHETSEEPRVPAAIRAAVEEKMDRRECLQCARLVPAGQSYRRGLCSKDYRKTQLQEKAGKATLTALMVVGLLGPKGPGGRTGPRTALDDFLSTSPLTIVQIEDAEKLSEEAEKETPPVRRKAKK